MGGGVSPGPSGWRSAHQVSLSSAPLSTPVRAGPVTLTAVPPESFTFEFVFSFSA